VIGVAIPTPQRAGQEACASQLLARLGEAAFTAAWESGQGLSWREAAAIGLAEPQGNGREAEE
jgi:hypothetical protein